MVVLLLLLAPALAHAEAAAPDTVRLVWTAPGDDGRVGTATDYELRVSASPINANNWDQATVVPGTPGVGVTPVPKTNWEMLSVLLIEVPFTASLFTFTAALNSAFKSTGLPAEVDSASISHCSPVPVSEI